MRQAQKYDELARLVAERGDGLLAAAVLLTGDRAAAEDLFQHALEKVMRRGPRLHGDPEGYLRRTMYHLAVDRWRGIVRRREVYGRAADAEVADHADGVELRSELIRVLRRLPPRQRAVLVLRYFEQLSEAESARVLGCSVGTVKSSTARALRRLRDEVGDLAALRP